MSYEGGTVLWSVICAPGLASDEVGEDSWRWTVIGLGGFCG